MPAMPPADNQPPPGPRAILLTMALALLAALVVLLVAILPAEFGLDPLGTGRWSGLLALSAEANPLTAKAEAHRTDYVEFELGPFQSVEYKYTMDTASPMVFSWLADGELYYDMHAEPAGRGEEYAESFEQGNATNRSGSFAAPFTGIHGWFWENRSSRTVLLRLFAAGYFVDSSVFRDGGDYTRVIDPVTQ